MSENEHSKLKEVGIPLISAAIALLGVLSGYVLNAWTEQSQIELKTFEVTFPEKQKNYSKIMCLLYDSFYSAAWRQTDSHYRFIDELEASYYGLEPFLSVDTRKAGCEEIQKFIAFCGQVRVRDPVTDMDVEMASRGFTEHRDKIRGLLFRELFEAQ